MGQVSKTPDPTFPICQLIKVYCMLDPCCLVNAHVFQTQRLSLTRFCSLKYPDDIIRLRIALMMLSVTSTEPDVANCTTFIVFVFCVLLPLYSIQLVPVLPGHEQTSSPCTLHRTQHIYNSEDANVHYSGLVLFVLKII